MLKLVAKSFLTFVGALLLLAAAQAQDRVVYHIDNAEVQALSQRLQLMLKLP